MFVCKCSFKKKNIHASINMPILIRSCAEKLPPQTTSQNLAKYQIPLVVSFISQTENFSEFSFIQSSNLGINGSWTNRIYGPVYYVRSPPSVSIKNILKAYFQLEASKYSKLFQIS